MRPSPRQVAGTVGGAASTAVVAVVAVAAGTVAVADTPVGTPAAGTAAAGAGCRYMAAVRRSIAVAVWAGYQRMVDLAFRAHPGNQ